MSRLDDLLDHLVIKPGDEPNGAGGEVRYWKEDVDISGKQAIKKLFLDLFKESEYDPWVFVDKVEKL